MAVEHIVLLRLKRPLDEAELRRVHSLKKIHGVRSISAGPNYTQRAKHLNYGIVVRFDSKEAELAYQTHEEHVQVRDTVLKPLITGDDPILAVDYEFEQPGCPVGPRSFVAAGLVAGVVLGSLAAKARR
jgi:hypothetical protein